MRRHAGQRRVGVRREFPSGGVGRHRCFRFELFNDLADLDTFPMLHACIHPNLSERLGDEVL